MRLGLVQLCASDDPVANLGPTRAAIEAAVADGAEIVMTPEVTNCVSASRTRQSEVLQHESQDPTIAMARDLASRHGIWIALGSVAVKTDDPDGRFANRSILVGADGRIVARYDKIHMFDVAVSETETYRESAGYRPGDRAVAVETPWGGLGLTVCYDVRFPRLFRDLAQAGAKVIAVPAAFSPVTGEAHWDSLLRARAIENGCFIVAAAQTGQHEAARGRARRTYGHSLVVSPWGEILHDMGEAPGTIVLDLDLDEVDAARRKVPSLDHDRDYAPPDRLTDAVT